MTYVSKKSACGLLAMSPPSYDLYQYCQQTGIVLATNL